jgi:hypothetical protein
VLHGVRAVGPVQALHHDLEPGVRPVPGLVQRLAVAGDALQRGLVGEVGLQAEGGDAAGVRWPAGGPVAVRAAATLSTPTWSSVPS